MRCARSLPGCIAILLSAQPAETHAQAPAAPVPGGMLVTQGAVLQGLDKITARVRPLEGPNDVTVPFGALRITVRACRKAPPEEAPEAAAFLEVVEERPGVPPQRVFSGWMYASSPALSALEHPVYDVWVTDCMKSEKSPGANAR